MSKRIERAVAKGALASELALTGAAIAGPVGAVIGGVTGLIVGDDNMVFPVDMVAIPAYQAYMLSGSPAFTVYIKAGETLMATGGNVDDVEEGIAEAMTIEAAPTVKKRKVSKYNKAYAKAFKQVASKYKKKDGGWMKDGFKRAQREAHKMAGGKK
jgi:hypothetical protein